MATCPTRADNNKAEREMMAERHAAIIEARTKLMELIDNPTAKRKVTTILNKLVMDLDNT